MLCGLAYQVARGLIRKRLRLFLCIVFRTRQSTCDAGIFCLLASHWPQLFKSWIALSTGKITIQLINIREINCAIQRIAITNNNELYLHDLTSTQSIAKAMFRNQNYNTGQLCYFDNNLSRTSKQAEIYFMNCILTK